MSAQDCYALSSEETVQSPAEPLLVAASLLKRTGAKRLREKTSVVPKEVPASPSTLDPAHRCSLDMAGELVSTEEREYGHTVPKKKTQRRAYEALPQDSKSGSSLEHDKDPVSCPSKIECVARELLNLCFQQVSHSAVTLEWDGSQIDNEIIQKMLKTQIASCAAAVARAAMNKRTCVRACDF